MIFDKLIISPQEITKKVFGSIGSNTSLMLTYLNQNCFNIYSEVPEYKRLLDQKFSVYPDGIGVFIFLRILFKIKTARIDATGINELILARLIEEKISFVIIGGDFDKETVHKEILKRGAALEAYVNGFIPENQMPDMIKSFRSKVYLIGMGVPRQELLAEKLGQLGDNMVIICAGNFFEFYFGTKKRAPAFLRNSGLEWAFRLFVEPGRLWKRYLLGIPVFVYRITKQALKHN